MNVKVAYYTRSGSTKKLADCIAKTAGVSAETIGDGAELEADVLFLGASVYWGGIDRAVRTFIAQMNPEKVKEVVVFSTSAMTERAYPEIRKLLTSRGIRVAEENFYCRGAFTVMHQGRPNAEDLKAAEAFTKQVLAKRA